MCLRGNRGGGELGEEDIVVSRKEKKDYSNVGEYYHGYRRDTEEWNPDWWCEKCQAYIDDTRRPLPWRIRLHGEWFEYGEEIKKYVESLKGEHIE
jgi:hypothetical protein